MRNLPPKRARFMRFRIALLAAVLGAGALAVTYRAYDLQVRDPLDLKAMAERQYLRDIKLSPKRGTIYDRNGAELAVSVDVDSVYANPRVLQKSGVDPVYAAGKLSALLGVDQERLVKRLTSKRYFVWVKRRLSPMQAKAVEALKLPGVALMGEARRFYPNRQLASHVLGFANIDGKGIEGLELSLEEQLRGSTDPVPAIRDRRGVVVFSEQLLDDRAAQGDSVVLTIDKTIQHIAERELELAVRTFEAKGGSVVVMDPATGEVLAIANYPTFNPNDPAASPTSHRRNRAVTDRFEPGSTIKPFTVAGALAGGAIRSDQSIDCEDGAMQVAEYTIHDTSKYESLTPGQILEYSSNIGTAKIGMALGRKRLYRTLRDFGFGQVSRVGLPGETSGILRHYRKWYEMDAATISFGQGMSVTALQLASAMGALANKGRLMRPILIKRIEDARGELIEEALPRVRRQVVPIRSARLVSDMMIAVTGEGGTAPEAALDGHLVAGKTGTAQKADYINGGYAEGKWTSSFVGYAPARKPRLVAAVVIDEPLIHHYGGTVAGPTFRRLMEASLRHRGVVATVPGDRPVARKRRRKVKPAEGEVVVEAKPDAPARELPEVGEGERLVPDLRGQTARGALAAVHKAGLGARLHGSGVVVGQEPEPFSVVPEGSPIQLRLEAPDHVREDELQEGQQAASDKPQAGPELAVAGERGRDG